MSSDSQKQARKISYMQLYVLRSLLTLRESHAYDIYKEVVRLNEQVPISESINAPSVYKSVDNLTKRGILKYRMSDDGRDRYPKRGGLYSIADEGWEVLVETIMLLSNIQQIFDD